MPTPPETRLPPGLLIRARRPSDAEGVADLVNLPGFRFGTSQLPFVSPEAVRARMDKSPPADIDLLGVVDGVIVGSASVHPGQGRQAHAGSIGIGVHDDWTGRGIGAALMGAVIDTAERWLGLRRLQLTVYVDNAAAIKLYRKFGFEIEGTHQGFSLRDGAFTDAHAMARVKL